MAASRRVAGVRVRTTLAATVVVAVVLAAAAVAFVVLQRHELRKSLAEVTAQRARDIASQLSADGLSSSQSRLPALLGAEGALVQVLDAHGTVVAASAPVEGDPPIVAEHPGPGQTASLFVEHLNGSESDPFVVAAQGVSTPDGDAVVIAAQNLETSEESTRVVVSLLVIGYPLIVLAVAAISFWLTGRALAPVRAMRTRVAQINGSDLTARVPVPPAGDEISRLAETMNAMLARLELAADKQRRFVADASHELRSPLTTIRASQEIALAHPKFADWEATSVDTLAEAERMDRLVSDLLLLARVDESGINLHLEDVDLDDVVGSEVARLRRIGELDVRGDVQPVRIVGDPHQLGRLLRNITDNAARHARSRVTFTLGVGDGVTCVRVGDDGEGIPPDQRERIFDRFVRLDQSRQRGSGGTGLGLSIAREIAIAHGGSLRVGDATLGALFELTLPVDLARGSGGPGGSG